MSRLALLAALALAPGALAGSAAVPEILDEAGDCTLPYGAPYLDLRAAWIGRETDETFVVSVALDALDETLAEGAGYLVGFEHQGVRWSTLAIRQTGAWRFLTGRADAGAVDSSTFETTTGAVQADEARIDVTFPKKRFPHDDPDDRELRGFTAATADLRPAYPFFAAEGFAPGASNGRWLVCDEGASAATYRFEHGAHSLHHEDEAPPAPSPVHEPTPAPEEPAPDEAPRPTRATPALGLLAGLVAGALTAAARRRP